MKTAYSLIRSTYVNESTAGLSEFVSRLDLHRQMLGFEILEHRDRMCLRFTEQDRDVKHWNLMPDLGDLKCAGTAYWKISP